MTARLTWDEIKTRYHRQWIELVECEWPEGEPYPAAGIVGVHASDKKAFFAELNRQEPKPDQSALLYVGQPERPTGAMYATPFIFRSARAGL